MIFIFGFVIEFIFAVVWLLAYFTEWFVFFFFLSLAHFQFACKNFCFTIFKTYLQKVTIKGNKKVYVIKLKGSNYFRLDLKNLSLTCSPQVSMVIVF